jgi:hypothetical protein
MQIFVWWSVTDMQKVQVTKNMDEMKFWCQQLNFGSQLLFKMAIIVIKQWI